MQYRTLIATALLLSTGTAAPLIARQENSTAVSVPSSSSIGPTNLEAAQSQPSVQVPEDSSSGVSNGASGVNEFAVASSSTSSGASRSTSHSGSSVSDSSSGSTGNGAVGGQEDGGITEEASEPDQGNPFVADPSPTAETAPSPTASGAANSTASPGSSSSKGGQHEDDSSQSESQGSAQGNELAAEPPTPSGLETEPSSVSGMSGASTGTVGIASDNESGGKNEPAPEASTMSSTAVVSSETYSADKAYDEVYGLSSD